MSLRGTLKDIGIVDLIQFPHAGRKTGELEVRSRHAEARLYYRSGNLVHVSCQGDVGIEALVRIVDWTEADFEFKPDVEATENTLRMDLHRAVMLALKTRDERGTGVPTAPSSGLEKILGAFIDDNPSVALAAALGQGGQTLCEAGDPTEKIAEAGEIKQHLLSACQTYPRPGLRRLLVEDEHGVVILTPMVKGGFLLIIGKHDSPIGALTVAVSRLAARISNGGPA